MSERFVNVDRDTPMMLPPDLREWVPPDHMVHFVLEVVDSVSQAVFHVNRHGGGSLQYPPQMMTALLIYCYSQGVFSSRKIEQATWSDVAVRYLTGDTHPDHDTIATFRRRNGEAIHTVFLQLLQLASEIGVLKVGTVSVDATHIKANASKHRSIRYDRCKELEAKLSADIDELLERAEAVDSSEGEGGERLPAEIARREVLREKIRRAREALEQRSRPAEDPPEQQQEDEEDPPRPKKRLSGKVAAGPRAEQQINMSDGDSALMRKSRRHGWEQAYNAQAIVDAEGSQLVLGTDVSRSPADCDGLQRAVATLEQNGLAVTAMLADAGYANASVFGELAGAIDLYVAVRRGDEGVRQYDFRPSGAQARKANYRLEVRDPRLRAMQEKLTSEHGRKLYARRKSTVEPVFGIIKHALGFRQFLLRGIQRVTLEWSLVCTAYNLRRLWRLRPG